MGRRAVRSSATQYGICATCAAQAVATPPADPEEAKSEDWLLNALVDVPGRLEDADKVRVDVQVVFPTLFIAPLTDDAELDVALATAYNRWLAVAHARRGGRL